MIKEIWKDIENYPDYQVSNLGRVRSLNYNRTGQVRVLKLSKDKDGYLFVNLWKNGKMKHSATHRLVALAFIPNPNNLPEVNHINEDKTDNRVENLSWVSRIQNSRHGTRNKRVAESLTNRPDCSKRVAQCTLDGTLVAAYPSTHEAARQTGFSRGNISSCCRGNTPLKTYKGYIWKYLD